MKKKTRAVRAPRSHAEFPYALRSFIGHLEGTSKAEHTIKNYRLDLLSFRAFLNEALGDRPVKLSQLGPGDLDRFHEWMKGQGLKNNTRRRKLLTVQKFLGYLSRRNKIPEGIARKFPTPHKIERIPATVPSERLLAAIRALPSETLLDHRNRVMLWTLAETGCQVSEVAKLRYDCWEQGPTLALAGKSARKIPVSPELFEAVQALRVRGKDSPWLFLGFNKFGSLGAPISPRGIELLVRSYAARLGFPDLTPRTFRHSAVLRWFSEGLAQKQIQDRLGLRTAYAFRVYEVMLAGVSARSTTAATSSS